MQSNADENRWTWQHVLCAVLVILSIALPVGTLREGSNSKWYAELRQLKTQRLHHARAVDVLKDFPDVVISMSDSSATVETLTVSLVESIEQLSLDLNAELTSLSVTDSGTEFDKHEQPSRRLHAVRIKFSAVVSRALELLHLLDALRETAEWRPIEVRGCTVTRLTDTARISANCSIDLYYFPGIDA